jgi:carbamoyltransferase
MKILGYTSLFHDSSACLLVDGDIKAYVEEERFNRKKHTSEHPQQAIDWVLQSNNLRLDDIDEVVYYLRPSNYLKTGVKAVLANFPKSLALARKQAATMPPFERLRRLGLLKSELCRRHKARGDFKLHCLDHYRTHQAGAFFASEFDDAAIITMDFAVDGTTEVLAHGRGNHITDHVKHLLPDGFAILYATVTHVLGFKWYDEYKVMGMAAYGEPKYLDKIEQLYRLDPETGDLKLDFKYFDFQNYGMSRLFSERMKDLFWEPRKAEEPITQREYDLASSLQTATNRYGVAMARLARRLTGSRNLCMAGGVAQNCLMNEAICEAGIFDNVFLQPLAGDVGGSIGGALFQYHQVQGHPRSYVMKHLYLGPAYVSEGIEAVKRAGLHERPSPDWHDSVAQAIADGLVVAFFDGRMEAGPRALGSRSILADARRKDMKDILNSRVKHREHFRPFAPSVLAEEVEQVFEPLPTCRSLDYMIVTMMVRPQWRERVPAISHADGTARVQTVRAETSPNYHRIIRNFYQKTGVPLVVNTSFNDNEPIVCRPEDAINCFKRTKIDLLVLDGKLYYREDNRDVVNPEVEAL